MSRSFEGYPYQRIIIFTIHNISKIYHQLSRKVHVHMKINGQDLKSVVWTKASDSPDQSPLVIVILMNGIVSLR